MVAGEDTRELGYLPFLDGLRAIAVLAVIVFHLHGPWLPGGYLGVDIFFVISGFTVSYALTRKPPPANFVGFLLDFYRRRIIRILPALLICLLITSLVAALFIPSVWLSRNLDRVGLFALFGASNFILAQGNDYFSPVAEFNPFTHTWSLGVEEQFYLLFPLLFFPWLSKRWRWVSVSAILLAVLISLGVFIWLTTHDRLLAFYMIYARLWELAAGVALFQASAFRPSRALALTALLGLAGVLAVQPSGAYPFVGNIITVVCTVVLIGHLRHRDASSIFNLLQAPKLRFVGQISYSLYLWHWPVIVLMKWTFGAELAWQMAVALLLTASLAIASYYLVERPIRESATVRRSPKFAVVAVGISSAALAIGTYNYIVASKSRLSLSKIAQSEDWFPYAVKVSASLESNCTLVSKVEGKGSSRRWTFTRNGCPPETDRRLFVLGDSHAMAYAPMIKRLTIETGIESVVFGSAGCPFISLDLSREGGACGDINAKNLGWVRELARPGDILFLPSLRLPRLANQWGQLLSPDDALKRMLGPIGIKSRERAIPMVMDSLAPILTAELIVVFEAPKPIFQTVTFRCVDWFNRTNPICANGPTINRSFIERLRAPVIGVFEEISSKFPNVYIWDPLPLLCNTSSCSIMEGSRPLFVDSDHISAYGNRVVAESFVSTLRRLPDRLD